MSWPTLTGTDHTCLRVHPGSPAVQRLGLGAAALRYQRLGYEVLALAPATKRPHKLFSDPDHPGTAGVHWATTDPAMVEHVWTQDRAAGIGIATKRLLVIDLDIKNGHDGEKVWRDFLASNNLQVPVSVWQATPSGGLHIWLRLPPGVTVPTRTSILPGVDIKGDGGYVAAAPTHIWVDSSEGARVLLPYRMNGCPCALPEAPPWLIEWIITTPGSGHGSGSGEGTGEPVDVGELAQNGLPDGARNDTLLRVACSLFRRFGTGPDGSSSVRSALQPVLDRTERAGFGEREISITIESARRFIAGQEQRELAAYQDVCASLRRHGYAGEVRP